MSSAWNAYFTFGLTAVTNETLVTGMWNLVRRQIILFSLSLSLSLSRFLSLPVAPTLEHRASVKRLVSLHFLNTKTVGRTSWTGDPPIARPLPTHKTVGRTSWTGEPPIARPLPTQTQNKHRQTSMPWVRFEPTIPAFERAKTCHALDRAATVIGRHIIHTFTNFVSITFLSQQRKYGDGANLCCYARQSSSQ
jgi:hypothetical protein